MTKRKWSWVFLLAALALAVTALWQARHPLMVLTRWKAAEGTLVSRELLRNHDADGFLYLQMQGAFRYTAEGKERTSSAVSFFGSSDFGSIAPLILGYKFGLQYPLRYDPANPDVFEFGAGFNTLYLEAPLKYLGAAAVCLLLGLLFWRISGPRRRCSQCNRPVRSHYRYCPECGESISAE